MIGNNSCGSTAQVFGKVADNVRRLEVLTYDGLRMWVGPTSEDEYAAIQAAGGRRAEIDRGLRAIAEDHAGLVAERFPDIPRRVSGYNLDDLVPGSGFDLARALVGSESTLVTVLHAELDLVTEARHTALVVLGFCDIVASARCVDAILPHEPHFLECIDRVIVEFQRVKGVHQRAMAAMPEGHSWLMAQIRDDDPARVAERAQALRRRSCRDRRPVRPHRHRPGRAGRALRHPGGGAARLGPRPAHRAGQLRGLGGRGAAHRPARRLPGGVGRPARGVRVQPRARRSTGTSVTAASTRASRSSSARRRASRPTARSWSARRTCA